MISEINLTGLHHVALVSRTLDQTSAFYGQVLGLPHRGDGSAPTVSLDREIALAPSPARFFGGAAEGGRGGLLSVQDRPGAPPGSPGIGGTHHFALAVLDRTTLLQWKRRLLDLGYPVNGILDRHYFQSIYTRDPDGTIVELATLGPGWTIDEEPDRLGESHRPPPPEMVNTNRDRARIAAENWPDPVDSITPSMQIRGLHHVTAIGINIEATHAFVGKRLGMRRVKRTSNFDDAASYHWYWGIAEGAPGTLVTYFERKPEREKPVTMGAGQIGHYGLSAPFGKLDRMRARLAEREFRVSEPGEFGPEGSRFQAIATEDPDGQPVLLSAPTE